MWFLLCDSQSRGDSGFLEVFHPSFLAQAAERCLPIPAARRPGLLEKEKLFSVSPALTAFLQAGTVGPGWLFSVIPFPCISCSFFTVPIYF